VSNLYSDFFMFLILTNLGLCFALALMIYLRVRKLEKQRKQLTEMIKKTSKGIFLTEKRRRECLKNLVSALEILDEINIDLAGRDDALKALIVETIEILAGFKERK